jgi:hypothetical protein
MQIFLQLLPLAGIKAHAIARRRTSTQRERVPIVLKVSEYCRYLDRDAIDCSQTGSLGKIRQSIARAKRKATILFEIRSIWIECCRGCPKGTHELHAATSIVPNIKRNRCPGARHPFHFGQRLLLVGDKIQDKRGHDHVPAGRLFGKRLRVTQAELDTRVRNILPGLCEEAFRWINGYQALRFAARQDSGRKRSGSAADIQPVQTAFSIEPVEEARSNLAAPSAHIEIVAIAGLPGIVS